MNTEHFKEKFHEYKEKFVNWGRHSLDELEHRFASGHEEEEKKEEHHPEHPKDDKIAGSD